MSSKKKTRQTTDQTQTSAPPSWTLPGLTETANRVTQAVRSLPGTGYEGDFYARPDEGLTQGIVDAYSNAANNAKNVGSQTQQGLDRLQGLGLDLGKTLARSPVGFNFGGEGGALGPAGAGLGNLDIGRVNDPSQFTHRAGATELDRAIAAGIDPVFENLEERVLPQIRSSALASGAYGNSRALATLPGQAIENATDEASNIAGKYAFEGLQREEDRRLSAYSDYERNKLASFGLNSEAAQAEERARIAAQQERTRAYGAQTERGLGQANIEAELAAGDADRRLEAERASAALELERAGLTPQLADTIMRMYASEGDLLTRSRDADIYSRQVAIDNALARDDYDYKLPFRGLDIGTDLLTRLSGGYGTNRLQGVSETTSKTSGLGQVAKGIGGLAAAGVSAFAPAVAPAITAASAAASAGRAAPASAAFSPGYNFRRG